jgi:predicted PurR-regulated permease PerM
VAVKKAHYALWALVIAAGYLALLLIGTYWDYLLFAILFAVLFAKMHARLSRKIAPGWSAFIIIILVLVLLVVPTIYVVARTVGQAPGAYQSAQAALNKTEVREALGQYAEPVRNALLGAGATVQTNLFNNASTYLSRLSDVLVGLFLMLIVTYYLLLDGPRLYETLLDQLPSHRSSAEEFVANMRSVIRAVVVGQVVTAIVQGILCGLLLWIFGIPNPLFWGVVATLLSIIPVLGPFLVYIPAAGHLLIQGQVWQGLLMLALGIIVISQIDNFLRPYIASKATKIHPLVVILGVLGGLKLWGLIGFILGPLVLAAFFALYEFAAQTQHARS